MIVTQRIDAARRLIREVNQRVFDVQGSFVVRGAAELFCECADEGCTEPLDVPCDRYEWLCTQEDAWVIVAGHEQAGEVVLARGDGYVIVAAAAPAGRPA